MFTILALVRRGECYPDELGYEDAFQDIYQRHGDVHSPKPKMWKRKSNVST